MRTPTAYLDETQRLLAELPSAEIEAIRKTLQQAHQDGKTLFVCGNGGSAATASHFALDMSKQGVPSQDQRHPRVMALNDSQAALTAWANDTDYSRVFLEQLTVWLQPGDTVMLISASGNSPNVVRAAEFAKERGAVTVGLTGFRGGKLASLCDYHLNVPTNDYGQVETVHMALCHYLVNTFQFPDA